MLVHVPSKNSALDKKKVDVYCIKIEFVISLYLYYLNIGILG